MQKLTKWQIGGFLFTSVLGTLLHFFYDWSGQSDFAALFSAVNESIWEHLKLLFFPMFLFALAQARKVSKEDKNFWCIKLIGILMALALTVVLYYTYTGIFGVNLDIVNISIFFVAAGVSYLLEWYLMQKKTLKCKNKFAPLAVLVLLMASFFIFTFYPPQIPLFRDIPTGTYGIAK